MKKFLSVLLLALLSCLSISAFGQTVVAAQEQARDPRKIAAAFSMLGRETRYYGNYDYYVVKSEGVSSYVYGYFIAEANPDGSVGRITHLYKNGVEIPLAAPLSRFPHDIEGAMTRVWMNVGGVQSENRQLSHGYFYTESLGKGDPIVINLKPSYVSASIKMTLPAGVNPDTVRLVTADGRRYWYDSWSGQFDVWIDPVLGNQDYTIVDASTGAVIQSGGVLGPFMIAKETPDNALGIVREEGVQLVSISKTNDWQSFTGQQFVTKVTYSDTVYPAKVFYADTLDGGNLAVSLYGISGPDTFLLIEEVLDDGSLQLIKKVQGDNYYELRTETKSSYHRLVITVLGQSAIPSRGFNVHFRRSPPFASSQ